MSESINKKSIYEVGTSYKALNSEICNMYARVYLNKYYQNQMKLRLLPPIIMSWPEKKKGIIKIRCRKDLKQIRCKTQNKKLAFKLLLKAHTTYQSYGRNPNSNHFANGSSIEFIVK